MTYRNERASPTLQWYMHEHNKKGVGLCNEIDINQIRLAVRGFKNEWSTRVKDSPALFDEFLQKRTPELWEKITQNVQPVDNQDF